MPKEYNYRWLWSSWKIKLAHKVVRYSGKLVQRLAKLNLRLLHFINNEMARWREIDGEAGP